MDWLPLSRMNGICPFSITPNASGLEQTADAAEQLLVDLEPEARIFLMEK